MSAYSAFLVKQKAFNDRIAGAVDGAVDSVKGLTADVAELNRKIGELQSSATIATEDKPLIDDLEASGNALTGRTEAVAAALKELDDATPPVPPAGPPV